MDICVSNTLQTRIEFKLVRGIHNNTLEWESSDFLPTADYQLEIGIEPLYTGVDLKTVGSMVIA